MDKYIIPGSVIGVSLLTMFIFMKSQKKFTLADVSSHSLVRSLGFDSSNHSTNSSRSRQSSMDTANYVASDNDSIGGKKKRKTRKK